MALEIGLRDFTNRVNCDEVCLCSIPDGGCHLPRKRHYDEVWNG
jgi:hypothetical protein